MHSALKTMLKMLLGQEPMTRRVSSWSLIEMAGKTESITHPYRKQSKTKHKAVQQCLGALCICSPLSRTQNGAGQDPD